MEELSLDYYFEHITEIGLGEVFAGVAYPWDAIRRKNDVLFHFQKSSIGSLIHPTVQISGVVSIGRGVVIESYTVIQGPVIIADHALIRSHALIRPFSVVGKHCVVGHSSEIKNSLIMDEAKIASFCFVGDSVIGFGARFGSFTVSENRRFDQKEVVFKVNGTPINSGTDKMGCVVGDYARTGGGCLVAPGTLIGKYSWVYSDTNVFGLVPKESLVKHRQNLEIVPKNRSILVRTDRKGSV